MVLTAASKGPEWGTPLLITLPVGPREYSGVGKSPLPEQSSDVTDARSIHESSSRRRGHRPAGLDGGDGTGDGVGPLLPRNRTGSGRSSSKRLKENCRAAARPRNSAARIDWPRSPVTTDFRERVPLRDLRRLRALPPADAPGRARRPLAGVHPATTVSPPGSSQTAAQHKFLPDLRAADPVAAEGRLRRRRALRHPGRPRSLPGRLHPGAVPAVHPQAGWGGHRHEQSRADAAVRPLAGPGGGAAEAGSPGHSGLR